MKTVLKNELYLTRKTQAVWLGLLLLLDGFCYIEFLSLRDSLTEIAPILDQLPPLMMLLFGVREDIATALGWYSCLYYWIGLLAFAYALSLGLTCLTKECKAGTAEALFTKPVSRRDIVLGKAGAGVVTLAVYALFAGLCNELLLILPMGGLPQRWAPLTTTVGLFLTQLVLFGLGLLIAALVPRPRQATRVGVVVLPAAYAVMFAAQYTGGSPVGVLSPLCWFDVLEVIRQGLRLPYLLLAGGVFALCLLGAQKGWEQREF